ncbi:hypothetical protein Sjap_005290 [Stephania japonica]|uniref:Uncharacterized protein n=1 Tax=Stephania japonica TaxID=461633 RepID=A0AAP0PIM0_9MAGN
MISIVVDANDKLVTISIVREAVVVIDHLLNCHHRSRVDEAVVVITPEASKLPPLCNARPVPPDLLPVEAAEAVCLAVCLISLFCNFREPIRCGCWVYASWVFGKYLIEMSCVRVIADFYTLRKEVEIVMQQVKEIQASTGVQQLEEELSVLEKNAADRTVLGSSRRSLLELHLDAFMGDGYSSTESTEEWLSEITSAELHHLQVLTLSGCNLAGSIGTSLFPSRVSSREYHSTTVS